MTNADLYNYTKELLGKGGSLSLFAPELILCVTIVLMLLWPLLPQRLFPRFLQHKSTFAFLGCALALFVAFGEWSSNPETREFFQGMLVYDAFTVYMRVFLLSFTALLILLTVMTGIPDTEDSADFYTLLLGAVLGMHLMVSANHLLMIFLAVEMASVPSYAIAGFLKGRRQSSEAALKFVVYGGASAGVMLYGLTILAGTFGTLHLPTLAHQMLYYFAKTEGAFNPTLLLALMLVLVGFAFKLSAFPFHFWCPDVFEGAAAEVSAFLSVASKGAAIALLARFVLALSGQFHLAPYSGEEWALSASEMTGYIAPTLAVLSAVTATFGNLAAYGQTNLKRLLAYSTIAHAGYMMMALVPMNEAGVKAAIFYLVAYLFMNLGAFAVVAFLRNLIGSEDLSAYEGLIYRAPCLTVVMAVVLLSLTGMPPLVGFVGKFMIFAVLFESGWYTLLVVGGLNTVISLVYYVNVLRVMIIRGEAKRGPSLESTPIRFYTVMVAAPVLVLGIAPWELITWSEKGARALQPQAAVAATSDAVDAQALAVKQEDSRTGQGD